MENEGKPEEPICLGKYLKNEREKEIAEGKLWLQMFTVNPYKLCSSDLAQYSNCA